MPNLFEVDLPPMMWHPTSAANAPSIGFHSQTYSKRRYWAFDETTSEKVSCSQIVLPHNMNSAASMKLKILYGNMVQASGSDVNIKWDVLCECMTVGSANDGSAVTGSNFDLTSPLNSVTAAVGTDAVFYMYAATVTLTNDDSASAGKPFRLILSRDTAVANDFTDDALFYGAMLYQEE